jgi:hypothetical protein
MVLSSRTAVEAKPVAYSEQHMSKIPSDRRMLNHVVVQASLALVAGVSWFALVASGAEGILPATLFILTLGLALTFGASQSRGRGISMSLLVAAAVVVGVFLAGGDLSENAEDGAFFIVLFAVVMTVLVLAAWLAGVAIGSAWRRVGR